MDFHNSPGRAVPLPWILLDSKSKAELVANPKMLVNIWTVQDENAICVHCNIVVKAVNQAGDLPGYGTVWYKPTGVTNILLMSRGTRK